MGCGASTKEGGTNSRANHVRSKQNAASFASFARHRKVTRDLASVAKIKKPHSKVEYPCYVMPISLVLELKYVHRPNNICNLSTHKLRFCFIMMELKDVPLENTNEVERFVVAQVR